MRARTALLVALALLASHGIARANVDPPAPSDPQAQPSDAQTAIAAAYQLIQKWAAAADTSGRQHDMSGFREQIETLREVLAANTDERTRIALTYYIAELERSVTADAGFADGKVDRALGQDALKNFDTVIAYGQDMPEWSIRLSEANYLAGSTAMAMGGSSEPAMRYWNVCAKQGHPGCVNNVAFELSKTLTASDDDIRHILDLHASVVATGTRYVCAGQFSAVSEAILIHLTGVGRPGDDDIGLLDKAQAFYRQLKDQRHAPDPCIGGRIGIDQYMMHLDRGERRPEFLDDVQKQSKGELWQAIATYLQGRMDEAALAKMIAASDSYKSCQLHFYAAWKAAQDGRKDVARTHYQAMLKIDPDRCSPQRLMMERYLKLPAGG